MVFINELASGFISLRSFRWIIGSSACKQCPCQTEASQADRFHLSPRTTEIASNRKSPESFTKVSIALKRLPSLRSSALLFFDPFLQTIRYQITRRYNSSWKGRRIRSPFYQSAYYVSKNQVKKIKEKYCVIYNASHKKIYINLLQFILLIYLLQILQQNLFADPKIFRYYLFYNGYLS